MSNVQFDEAQYSNTRGQQDENKGIIGFLVTRGFAKDRQQANLIMIGIIVVMAIIFFISISSFGSSTESVVEPIAEDPYINL